MVAEDTVFQYFTTNFFFGAFSLELSHLLGFFTP